MRNALWRTTAFVFITTLSVVGMIPFGRDMCTVKYCIYLKNILIYIMNIFVT